MTPAQLATLKAYIAASPTLSAIPNTDDGAFAIAVELNKAATPAYVVWRSSVTQDEIMQNGFDWTRVDNLNIGPARVWEWMFASESKSINPSKANVRAGIEAVWKGTAADLAVRDSVYAHCKRNASDVEKLYATGSGTTVSPSVMGFEGPISYLEVRAARNI